MTTPETVFYVVIEAMLQSVTVRITKFTSHQEARIERIASYTIGTSQGAQQVQERDDRAVQHAKFFMDAGRIDEAVTTLSSLGLVKASYYAEKMHLESGQPLGYKDDLPYRIDYKPEAQEDHHAG